MCGRYALHSNPEVVAPLFGLSEVPAYQPRYNIAPASQLLVIREGGAALLKWGLVPRWAKDPSMGAKMNNAREWKDLQTCAVITTESNAKMAAMHERMPVIVSPAEYSAWLAGESYAKVALRPCPDGAIEIRRVSRAVNNARADVLGLIEPEDG